jgi:hypothetical protein
LWAGIVQRMLALNACIWHNWMIGAPVKRSPIARPRALFGHSLLPLVRCRQGMGFS